MTKKVSLPLNDSDEELLDALVEQSDKNNQTDYLRDLIRNAAAERDITSYEDVVAAEETDEYDPREYRSDPLSSAEVREIIASRKNPLINPDHVATTSLPRARRDKAALVAAIHRFKQSSPGYDAKGVHRTVKEVLGPFSQAESRKEYAKHVSGMVSSSSSAVESLDDDPERTGGMAQDILADSERQPAALLRRVADKCQRIARAYDADGRLEQSRQFEAYAKRLERERTKAAAKERREEVEERMDELASATEAE